QGSPGGAATAALHWWAFSAGGSDIGDGGRAGAAPVSPPGPAALSGGRLVVRWRHGVLDHGAAPWLPYRGRRLHHQPWARAGAANGTLDLSRHAAAQYLDRPARGTERPGLPFAGSGISLRSRADLLSDLGGDVRPEL